MPPSFPVFAKTWQAPIVVDLPLQSTATLQNAAASVAMLNAFLSPPVLPWTMMSCSDSTAVSTTTNLIVDPSDIVASTSSVHTWWRVRNADGMEMVVDFNKATNTQATVVFSVAAGFTGGTTSARPTAADEAEAASVVTLYFGATTARTQLILMHSTDGTLTYAFVAYRGVITSAWLIGQAQASHGSWSPARIGLVDGSGSLATTGLNNFDWLRTLKRICSRAASGVMRLQATAHYSNGQRMEAKQTARRSAFGKWQHWSIGLACVDSPRRGRHGRMLDLWRVPESIPPGWIMRSDDGSQCTMTIGIGWAIPWGVDTPPAIGI